MYKKIKTDVSFIQNNIEYHPVATLEDEYGGKCQIIIDDHCYVLKLKGIDGKYFSTSWIFPEAFEVLKSLPLLKRN